MNFVSLQGADTQFEILDTTGHFQYLLWGSHKFIKPTENLVMPLQAGFYAVNKGAPQTLRRHVPIPMIQHPVVLIREDHKAARNV